MMKKINLLKIVLLIFAFILTSCRQGNSNVSESDSRIVAHAMGEVNGDHATNSLEAFETNYSNGTRYFEVDFFNTADHRIVAIHDWIQWFGWLGMDINDQPYRAYSHADFMETKIAGKYTALDLESIAQLMIDHPDMYLITDTKRTAEKLYSDDISRIYIALEMAQEGLSDRLIVQAYNEINIAVARKLLPDQNIIFTAYMSGLNNAQLREILVKYPDLYGFTIEKTRVTEEIVQAATDAGLKVFAHTVNSDDDYENLFSMGIHGIYTDDLSIYDIAAIAD